MKYQKKKKKQKNKNNKKERLRGLNENSSKLKSIIYSLTLLFRVMLLLIQILLHRCLQIDISTFKIFTLKKTIKI